METNRDIASQLKIKEVGERFSSSAGQRELVKEQIKLGKSPVEIEREERVAKRVIDMGVDEEKAVVFAESVKSAHDSRESRTIRHPSNPGLERIIGENDLISSVFLERGAEATKSVCCIQEHNRRIGTGFLVTPRVLLTNAHVIPDKGTASVCTAEFDYEDKLFGEGLETSCEFRLLPDQLFYASRVEDLDYALVAVEARSITEAGKPVRPLSDFKYLELDTSVANALRGECLNILQHPDGAPKRVALRQNRFTALLEKYVHYESDTLPGSSGSPVFNDQWQVICLHHAGVPLKDDQGRILTVDNRVWRDGVDHPALIKWIGNEGIRISRIIDDVIRQVKKEHGNRWPALLDKFPNKIGPLRHEEESLQNDPTSQATKPVVLQSNPASPVKPDASATAPASHPRSFTGGGDVTVSVTVGNGQPVVIKVGSGQGTSASESTTSGVRLETLEERGRQNLERAKTRKCYDKARDEVLRGLYYDGIAPDSNSFIDDLRELLIRSHTRRLSYRVARIEHLYAWVDLQKDKKVRSIYSDESFDPRKFISEDLAIERRLERLAERRLATEGQPSPEAIERLAATLAAREPFNCEHAVPQLWFHGEAPMQGDLHHLFACEQKCRSLRGSYPYRSFGKFSIKSPGVLKDKCGFTEDAFFEPFMGKGKVARATLYVLARYAGQFENMYDEVEDAMETLLDWHERSKVSTHELHRNQAIFEIQGNRNPFIDHPGWARIFFGKTSHSR